MSELKDNNLESLSDRQKEANNDLVFSYLTQRNLIGVSGILLPFILLFTTLRSAIDKSIEPSISDYYYTSTGDVLVVSLSVLGVFLLTYFGYKWQENVVTTIAAICAVGIAFSPTATHSANSLSIHTVKNSVPLFLGVERHFIFASLFFISAAVMSLVYFPRTNKKITALPDGSKTQKAKRNIVYRVCGWIIVGCVFLLGIYLVTKPVFLQDFPFVFVFEAIAVEAFGISWLTKGQTLWPDSQHYLSKAYDMAIKTEKG